MWIIWKYAGTIIISLQNIIYVLAKALFLCWNYPIMCSELRQKYKYEIPRNNTDVSSVVARVLLTDAGSFFDGYGNIKQISSVVIYCFHDSVQLSRKEILFGKISRKPSFNSQTSQHLPSNSLSADQQPLNPPQIYKGHFVPWSHKVIFPSSLND